MIEMRRCDDCRIILEDGVRFCPKCGQAVGGGLAAPSPEVLSLLTSANLHRMKGELDKAAADASAAMKRDPDNADAAALLASVFEQRGDLAEAAVWLKIAADLDPSSTAHKAQLDRIGQAAGSRDTGGSGLKLPRNPVLWAAGVGLLALIIVLIVALSRGGPGKPGTVQHVRAPVQIVTPEAAQARRTGAYPEQRPAQTRRPSAQPQGPTRTSGEVALKAAASEAEGALRAGARIDDVIADPRQRVAIVTFSIPGTGILTREKVLAVSESVARALFAGSEDLLYVTARCVVPSEGSGGTQIGFVGDTARQTIQALPNQPAAEQLSAAFANQWWNEWIK